MHTLCMLCMSWECMLHAVHALSLTHGPSQVHAACIKSATWLMQLIPDILACLLRHANSGRYAVAVACDGRTCAVVVPNFTAHLPDEHAHLVSCFQQAVKFTN